MNIIPRTGTDAELAAILKEVCYPNSLDGVLDPAAGSRIEVALIAWRDAAVDTAQRATAAARAAQTERDRAVPAAQLLAGRIDQLIGWAKSGKLRDRDDPDVEYYLMDVENVDPLRDHILHAVADCGYRAVAVPAREPIKEV